MGQAMTELEALKSRLKGTWMSGDFDKIARVYEPGAVAFIERLGLTPGTRVLDVACGSGNLSLPAARAGAVVTGLDIAPNLIETARRRAHDEGLEINFDEGDAEQLPYADASFDVVVTMFGAMFAPRPETDRGGTAASLPSGRSHRDGQLDAGGLHRPDVQNDRRARAAAEHPFTALVGRRGDRPRAFAGRRRRGAVLAAAGRLLPADDAGADGRVFPRLVRADLAGLRGARRSRPGRAAARPDKPVVGT